jgi:uncharacterized protein YdhG (YjbR/CyaY superfamily)
MKTDPALTEYLDSFPAATRKILDKIRATVRKAVPDAEESRNYGVGAFKRGGTYVIYYGGYPKHVAVYPVYASDAALGAALKPYTSGKATAKFPLDKPIPYDLIAKIVKAKVKEAEARMAAKAVKIAKPKKGVKKVAVGAKDASPVKKKVAKKVAKKVVKKAVKRK